MVKSFRHDINALRAIAVMAVLLFHFRVPGFAGGFVGVDVFFVMSGYLMTAVIATGLQQQTFSLWRFYLARARRILPGLAALVITLLFIGWWLLPQTDYRELAANSVYALIFISNIRFQRDAGYFEPASHENWLLHTWSLAVEWQFYLLLPLILMLIWRFRPNPRYLLTIIIALLLLSLARSAWLANSDPDAAFFLLQSRAWQLLAGAAAYLLSQHQHIPKIQQHSKLATTAGLLLILTTMATINANTTWPGLAAIAPVAGTVLILLVARQSAWMRLTPVYYLGLSSYSIYLWHWPVVVALVFLGAAGNPLAVSAGMALSLALGLLSWRLIENPTRRQMKPRFALPVIFAITLMPALWIYTQQGMPGRLAPEVERAAAEAQNYDSRRGECLARNGFDTPWCQYGGSDIQAIVIGDSHANNVVTAVAKAVQIADPTSSAGVMAGSYNGCPTLLQGNSTSNTDGCRAFNDFIRNQIQSMPNDIPLIIVNRNSVYHLGSDVPGDSDFRRPLVYYQSIQTNPSAELTEQYTQDLIATACHFAEQRPVYLLRPIPEMAEDVPRSMARRHLLNRPGEIRISRASYNHRHADVWQAQDAAAQQCGVHIVDPTQTLCDSDYCYGSDNGRPLYYDEDHLSEFGNQRLIELFGLGKGDGGI